jgi:heme exporter protein B
LRAFWLLVGWDWAREAKRMDTILSMVVIALLTLFVFSFAIPPTREVLVETRGGIVWVTFLLAGVIGIDRAFRADGDGRVLEGLLLAPVGRTVIYYARVASTLLFVTCMEVVTLILFLVLFDQSLDLPGLAAVSLAGLAATLVSAMTWSLRGGEVLMRILLFPLLVPLVAAAVAVTNDAFAGRAPRAEPLGVICAFDLVFLGAGQLLFEHVVQDVEGGP